MLFTCKDHRLRMDKYLILNLQYDTKELNMTLNENVSLQIVPLKQIC